MFFEVRQRYNDWIDVNAAFIESVDEPIEEKLLRAALRRVAATHPMLRVNVKAVCEDGTVVEDPEEGDYLIFEEKPDLEVNLERITTNDWNAVVEAEFVKGFDSNRPLWRVKLLDSHFDDVDAAKADGVDKRVFKNVLIFSFHHGIIDGLGIMRFYDQLMDELCAISATQTADGSGVDDIDDYAIDLPTIVSMPMPPSAPEALPSRFYRFHSFRRFLLYFFTKLWLLLSFSDRLPMLPHVRASCAFKRLLPDKKKKQRSKFAPMKLIPIRMTKKFSSDLAKACKKNGCKLTGTLDAVAHLALARALVELRGGGVERRQRRRK